MNTSSQTKKLRTNRGLIKFVLLGIITFGIYDLFVFAGIARDINIVASRYDGKKTMSYWLVFFIFNWLTFGIVRLVWSHRLCARMGDELRRRSINYSFSASTFWLCILYSYLISIASAAFSSYAYLMQDNVNYVGSMIWLMCAAAVAVAAVIGPCVFIHKLTMASNLLNESYNTIG